MYSYPLVDFHTHFVDPQLPLKPVWESMKSHLASLEGAEARVRVISTPLEFLRADADCAQVNERLAEAVARAPQRLHGLATVDAYGGDAAARELERAVGSLGLRGVFMESAKGELLPDAPQARPTLAVAAARGVPVFLHPIADAQLEARFKRFGRHGARLGRGTINSAALYALLEGGVFEALPGLRVVVTALAFGGILLAAGAPDGARMLERAPPEQRRRVYVDTTGMVPASIRAAIELMGADYVVMGTDWPVVQERDLPARLQAMFDDFGLEEPARAAVSGGNALRLMGVS